MSHSSLRLLIDFSEGLRLTGGSRALYLRLLARFPADESCARLKAALQGGNAAEAFLHAHTLKGLSAQLALPELMSQAACLCEMLRPQDASALPAACAALPSLLDVHQRTILAIEDYRAASVSNP